MAGKVGNPNWVAGKSGNPSGKPEQKHFTQALRMVLAEEDPSRKLKRMRVLSLRLYEIAIDGEEWAFQMIADRIEGKVAQEPAVQVNNQMTLEMLVGASMRSVAEHKVPQIEQ